MHISKKAVTLLELLITIVLLSLIVFLFNNIDLFSRYHLISAERQIRLQNEVSFVLEHMHQHIIGAIGDASNFPIKPYTDNRGIRVRIDDNPADGRISTTDSWIAYRHIGSEIKFYDNAGDSDTPNSNSGIQVLATHIKKTPAGSTDPKEWGVVFIPGPLNNLEVSITARLEPDKDVSPDNPELTMTSIINMPSVSLH